MENKIYQDVNIVGNLTAQEITIPSITTPTGYTVSLPAKTGTIALTSDISSVPTIRNGSTAVSNLTFTLRGTTLAITTS